MADNVAITAGSGTTIATDDAGAGGHVQLVKLAIATDGSATLIPADASGLLVKSATAANLNMTEASAANALTALQLIDDPVATLGTTTYTETTTKGMIVGAVRRDADTTLVDTTNEVGPLQMDANGRLKVEAFSGETLPVSLTSTTITGTVTVDSELPTAAAISAENTAAPTAPSIYNFPLLFDGTNWDRAPGTSADGALVNLGANNDVTVTSISAGTNNIGDVDVLTVPTDPFGANADAASATGSISAKLRTIATAIKAEDAGHTTADTGYFTLGVRNDADVASAGTDLDYSFFSTDAGGNQNVRARKHLVKIAVTSSGLTTSATAYAAGDQLGAEMTFAGAARASGGGGTIVGAVLISAADTIGAVDLVITRQAVAEAADNAAFALSDADALFIEGYVSMAGAYDIGNNRICIANNLAIPYTCAATSLFVNMITRSVIAATPFAAGTDIQLNLYVELN